jgi:transforming growth factor-beta-induced protein
MKTWFKLAAILSAMALVVAACGGDDDATDTTADTSASDTTTAESTDTTMADDSTDTTMAEESTDTTMAEEMGDTIVDIAAGNEDFSTLVAAVEAAGLTDALADPDATLTVFAPTNDAFEAALEALGLSADELLADTETLTAILTYHVLGEVVTSADIAAAGTEEIPVETLSGEELVVVVGDAGSVSFLDQTATVTQADLEASNGVIHIIDAVLLPPSMQ